MDITKRVAHNLSAWMDGHKTLITLKKVAEASGVGFGTVRRALGREPGNITVQNLEAIAKAFGKTAEELLAEPKIDTPLQANEAPAGYQADSSRRVPTRLANLTDDQLDKLLAVLNLLESWESSTASTSPATSVDNDFHFIQAGDPQQQPATDTDHQNNT